MPDTDYDDLPSPPRARARANTAAGTSGRTYGRKAGRKRARGESAHTGRGGDATGGGASAGAGTVRSGSSDDEDARGPRGKGKGEGKPRGEGGEGARRGRARRVTSRARREREEDEEEEEQGDVESNDEAVGRGVAPGGSKVRVRDSISWRSRDRKARADAPQLPAALGEGSPRHDHLARVHRAARRGLRKTEGSDAADSQQAGAPGEEGLERRGGAEDEVGPRLASARRPLSQRFPL